MKHEIPEAILNKLKEHGLHTKDNYWQLKQNKLWIVKHKALEKLAIAEGIVFDMPQMIENDTSNKTVAMIVQGRLGDKVEWSVGEAAPGNCMNNYPYAMAEKRAKDRVTLKLLGVSGDVYSEDESDDFKQQEEAEEKNRLNQFTPSQQIGLAVFGFKEMITKCDDTEACIKIFTDIKNHEPSLSKEAIDSLYNHACKNDNIDDNELYDVVQTIGNPPE